MKRTVVLTVLLTLLSLLLVVPAPAGPVIDRILQKGELVVGTTGEQPPLTAKTKDGEIIGLDADLARIMARAMGVKLKMVDMDFPKLLPALKGGRIDMILSGMTMLPQRNLRVAFVGPYYVTGKGILTKIQTAASMQDASEMNKPEFSLVALKDSTSQLFAEKLIPQAKLTTTKSMDEAVNLVIEGKVDALIADYHTCAVSAFRYRGKGLAAGKARFTYEPLGIALPEGDPLLINWVENILMALEGSGDLDRLKTKWFEDASWVERLP